MGQETRILCVLEWAMALAALLAAILTGKLWLVVAGIAGCLLAASRISARFLFWLRAQRDRQDRQADDSGYIETEDAFYASILEAQKTPKNTQRHIAPHVSSPGLVARVSLWRTPHNRLSPAAFNLHGRGRGSSWC